MKMHSRARKDIYQPDKQILNVFFVYRNECFCRILRPSITTSRINSKSCWKCSIDRYIIKIMDKNWTFQKQIYSVDEFNTVNKNNYKKPNNQVMHLQFEKCYFMCFNFNNTRLPLPFTGTYFCLSMIMITVSTILAVIVTNMYFRGVRINRAPAWLRTVSNNF